MACARLIPARAGKTSVHQSPRTAPTAHPRAGGENGYLSVFRVTGLGSSPRGRGKPSRRSVSADRVTAHPRAGGENRPVPSLPDPRVGSSPRGRGKLLDPIRINPRKRLIPARAGKTARAVLGRSGRAAHPRAGGENVMRNEPHPRQRGSSPRGRGKHFLTCAFIERIGQILETLELAVSSGSYSLCDVYATDAPQDQARNTGLALPSSRAAS